MTLAVRNTLAGIKQLAKYSAIAVLLILFLTSSDIATEMTRFDLDWSKADYDLIDFLRDYEWSNPAFFIDESSQDGNANFIDPPSEFNIDGDLLIGGNITHCYFDVPVTVHGSLIVERFIEVAFYEALVVEGDLVVSGSLQLSDEVTVNGDVIVLYGDFWQGNSFNSTQMRCNSLNIRDGSAYVDSIVAPMGITVGRDLYCHGDILSEQGDINIRGDLYVDGDIQCRGKLQASVMFIDGNCLVESEIIANMGGIYIVGNLESHNSIISSHDIDVGGDITGWSTIAVGIYQVMRNRDYNTCTIRCNRLISGDVIAGELIETSGK